MKNYEISVIIPVHNTDLKLFSNCIDSLKNQEIGFENVEVIAVLHNCNKETVEGAKDLLTPYGNIIVAELNNDSHSPSSPRNYGIEKATGDYVTFLDSDDMLTPECLKLSLEYVRKSKADICHFRKKVRLENEGNFIFNELVLWDQTKEMIVLDMDELDQHMYFAGAWGMSTGKLIRRKLLIDNNFRFDETIRFAEDYHFMLSIFGKVKTICLAPQLIGYIYFVNGQSLVQNTKVTEELLLEYVSGFRKVFDRGIENHIWMNDTMGSVMIIILNWMRACPDLTDEGRKKIQEWMGPYIRMLKPLRPSKLYPGGKGYRINTFLSKYILHENPEIETFIAREDEGMGKTFIDRQKDALSEILRNGSSCDYSRHYRFSDIITIEEYERRLPVSTYETFLPMIQLTTQMGERGIFTDNEITAYFISYNEDKEKKRLPVTHKALVPYVNALRRSIGTDKTFLVDEALPFEADKLTMDYKYTNSVFGVVLKEYISEAESFGSGYASFTTPKEYLFPKKKQDMKLMRLCYALKERNLETIFSPDPDKLCACFKELDSNREKLCRMMEDFDRYRADELVNIFKADSFSLKEIWPSLKKVVCWNITDESTISGFNTLLKDVAFNRGYYADEYALYGQICGDHGEIKLLPDYVFYEFMKTGESSEKPACTGTDISVGEEYRLFISNLSGLYRYDTETVVKCIEKDEEKVVVRINRKA